MKSPIDARRASRTTLPGDLRVPIGRSRWAVALDNDGLSFDHQLIFVLFDRPAGLELLLVLGLLLRFLGRLAQTAAAAAARTAAEGTALNQDEDQKERAGREPGVRSAARADNVIGERDGLLLMRDQRAPRCVGAGTSLIRAAGWVLQRSCTEPGVKGEACGGPEHGRCGFLAPVRRSLTARGAPASPPPRSRRGVCVSPYHRSIGVDPRSSRFALTPLSCSPRMLVTSSGGARSVASRREPWTGNTPVLSGGRS